MMAIEKVQAFCVKMYEWALQKAEQEFLDQTQYRKQIDSELKKSKLQYSSIKKIVLVTKCQWIEDLLQITKDLRLSFEMFKEYHKKLLIRSKMHFTNGHKQNLTKQRHKNQASKNVLEMYHKDHLEEWSQDKAMIFCDKVLSSTVYLVGLTKANGVIVKNEYVITCAHALVDQDNKVMKFRCFVTGNGVYGIMKVQNDNVCTQTDVGIGKIIKIFNSKYPSRTKNPPSTLTMQIPQSLKYKSQFSPIRCLQLGLLFNTEPSDSFIKVFEPAEGFIERNLYNDDKDHRLIDDMGLIVHNCYGLWGTSGSPLWTGDGDLIGIHNAWNENGYNVSMIVHDDDRDDVRVVKQYERRAIGVHVLMGLFGKWFGKAHHELDEMNEQQPEFQFHQEQATKKKVKIS